MKRSAIKDNSMARYCQSTQCPLCASQNYYYILLHSLLHNNAASTRTNWCQFDLKFESSQTRASIVGIRTTQRSEQRERTNNANERTRANDSSLRQRTFLAKIFLRRREILHLQQEERSSEQRTRFESSRRYYYYYYYYYVMPFAWSKYRSHTHTHTMLLADIVRSLALLLSLSYYCII